MHDHFVSIDIDSLSATLEEKIIRFARVPHYVLITGERGTGKTTIARRLHELSIRSKRDFISVNCASFTSELLESELFGYERGAFTGATAPKAGLFETCNGGTLFLDEIGELTLGLQAKLLKAVEEKRIRRVGSTSERTVDVRVIAATSRDLHAMVRNREFRPDLFDRLNILQLETIPLRYQRSRIGILLKNQLEEERNAVRRGTPFVIDENAMKFLEDLEWCGNYRELRNFATRLAVETVEDPTITLDLVQQLMCSEMGSSKSIAGEPRQTTAKLVTVMLDPEKDDLETIYIKAAATFIEHALRQPNGSLRNVARSMGSSHTTLARILRKHKNQTTPQYSSSPGLAFAAAG